jgi:hypothetical protein
MPFSKPYYSVSSSDRPVFHNKSNCPEGERIKKEDKRYGTDNRPLCKECQKVR